MGEVIEQMKKLSRAELRRLEREQKKKSVAYSFTHEQLMEHDRKVKAEYRKQIEDELVQKLKEHQKYIDAEINREWKEREEEFNSGDYYNDLLSHLQYTLAIPVKILVEQFGWKPLYGDKYDSRCKLWKFRDAVLAELEKIGHDENADVRKYAATILDKYNVGWRVAMDCEEVSEEEKLAYTE